MCLRKTSVRTSCELTATPLFPQIDEQCELKAIEKEKSVLVLPPKEACKCHKEELARALYVRVGFASDVSVTWYLG
jgi:hypothetical protein